MKRWFYLITVMALILVVATACGGDSETGSEDTSQNQPTAPEETVEEPTVLPPPVITEKEGPTEGNPPIREGAEEQEAPVGEETTPAEPAAEPEGETAEPEAPWSADEFGYGVQIHGNATVGDPVHTMSVAKNDLGMDWVTDHEQAITTYAWDQVHQVEGVRVLGPGPEQRGGLLSFVLGDIHPHDVAAVMDMQGIAVRAGHHCAQPIHDHYGITATSRASFYVYNTEDEVDRFVAALYKTKEIFEF